MKVQHHNQDVQQRRTVSGVNGVKLTIGNENVGDRVSHGNRGTRT